MRGDPLNLRPGAELGGRKTVWMRFVLVGHVLRPGTADPTVRKVCLLEKGSEYLTEKSLSLMSSLRAAELLLDFFVLGLKPCAASQGAYSNTLSR